MNKLNTTMLAAVVVGLLAGCASTSNDSQAPAQYPVLKVLSDKPYVWDDSISEALNVARMAQPAGVGNGMQDFSDGTLANTGRIGGGMRAFDAGLGLLSKGIFGVIQHEALSQGVNRQVDWKPSLVTLVNSHEIYKNNTIDFLKVRNIVFSSIVDSLKIDFNDINVIGYYTSKEHERTAGNAFVAFRSKACLESAKLDNYYSERAKTRSIGLSDGLLESPVELNNFCAISVRISISGKKDNQYIIVSEVQGTGIGTHYFDKNIARNLKNGYFIMPEFYDFVVSDRPGVRKGIDNGYARVFRNGRELLFQKK